VELMRFPAPGGKIGHAEIRIGDSPVMLADESPEMNARSARTIGGSPISLMVYVEDVDALVARAVAAGAKLVRPVANHFYGDRIGEIRLTLPALVHLQAGHRDVVWIAPPHLPYAPALAAAGLDLARLLIVRCRSVADQLWAYEQALRAPECGAAFAWLGPHDD